MTTRKFLAGIFLFAAFINQANSEIYPGCKGGSADVLKLLMQRLGHCNQILGFTGREKAKKMNCLMKCVMSDITVLNEEGYLDIRDAIRFLLAKTSMGVIGQALTEYHKAYELIICVITNSPTFDPKDPFCKSYEMFVKCMTNFFMNLCKESPPNYPVINIRDSEDTWKCSDC